MNSKGIAAQYAFALLIVVGAGALLFLSEMPVGYSSSTSIEKFTSRDEMKLFLKTNIELADQASDIMYRSSWGWDTWGTPMAAGDMETTATNGGYTTDYSSTNIQVEGVDEADIVKTDGKYLYVVTGNKIVIIDAYPAETARIVSEIELTDEPQEIFINGNKLVIFGDDYTTYRCGGARCINNNGYSSAAFIKVYDLSNKANPVKVRDVSFDGYYYDSRMIGDYVYIIINQPIYYDLEDDELPMPRIYETGDGEGEAIDEYTDVYYFDIVDRSYGLTTIVAVNTQNDFEPISDKVILSASTHNLFVSQDNIYITYSKTLDYIYRNPAPLTTTIGDIAPSPLNPVPNPDPEIPENVDMTAVHRIAISGSSITPEAEGEFPGTILNQFSMDEYNDYFRVATTSGSSWGWGTQGNKNNVYILSMDLNIVGKVENLAPSERIYSARFMGDRAYLVTFKQIDPFFVIDVSNPYSPQVLGELKIPGFSTYLHPYDENHVIGIGKGAIDAEGGEFAWFQGVKMSLFDVTDVSNPTEITKYIGDRGSESYALNEHKAFLFDKQRDLLVIPIYLAQIDRSTFPGEIEPWVFGEPQWEGAYVFELTVNGGFDLKTGISHMDAEDFDDMSYYYYGSPLSIQRTMYIGNVLYTISKKKVKMNSLDDYEEINSIDLPYEGSDWNWDY